MKRNASILPGEFIFFFFGCKNFTLFSSFDFKIIYDG